MNVLFVTKTVNYIVEKLQETENVNLEVIDCSLMSMPESGHEEPGEETCRETVLAKIRNILDKGETDALAVYDCPFVTTNDLITLSCKESFLIRPQADHVALLKLNDRHDAMKTVVEHDVDIINKPGSWLYNEAVEFWSWIVLDVFMLKTEHNLYYEVMYKWPLGQKMLWSKSGKDIGDASSFLENEQYERALTLALRTKKLMEAVYDVTGDVDFYSRYDFSEIYKINHIIGCIYWKKGEHDKARPYIERSVELVTRLGKYYESQRNYTSANVYYVLILFTVFRTYGKESEAAAQAHCVLARFQLRWKEYAKAIESASNAHNVAKQIYGEIHPFFIQTLNLLCKASIGLEEYDKALAYAHEILDLCQALCTKNMSAEKWPDSLLQYELCLKTITPDDKQDFEQLAALAETLDFSFPE